MKGSCGAFKWSSPSRDSAPPVAWSPKENTLNTAKYNMELQQRRMEHQLRKEQRTRGGCKESGPWENVWRTRRRETCTDLLTPEANGTSLATSRWLLPIPALLLMEMEFSAWAPAEPERLSGNILGFRVWGSGTLNPKLQILPRPRVHDGPQLLRLLLQRRASSPPAS